MPVFAAVDIGSNSVRLKIARLARRRLQPLHEDREVTRLGESVFAAGLLAPQAMAQTVKVLERFHRAVQKHGADAVRVVATSALRDARNAQAFSDWVHSTTGWRVDIISGLDEARLIHLGILASLRLPEAPVLLVDLGGGSCELTVSARGHIRETVSLPLGAVRLTREFLEHDPPKKYEMERLREFIAEEVARNAQGVAAARPRQVIATSGTAAAIAGYIASRKRESEGKSRRRERRVVVSRAAAAKLAKKLAKMSLDERMHLEGIGPRRAEIIVAGATVFAEVMQRCELRSFRYSPLGLRDGVLAEMAAHYDRRSRSRRQIESDRWDALLRAGERYQVDMPHARKVRELAMELFRFLRQVHRLPPEYEEWLSAAAMLHEVGNFMNRAGRWRHSYYIIAHSEIFGFTPGQRRIIAAIARYLGKSKPASGDRIVKVLGPADRVRLPKAVCLMRLAAALNQGRRDAVTGLAAQVKNGRVSLRLKARPRTGADLELWALGKERGYFREVFGRELEAKLA
jgi:exopolyphosphatase/guanosine-5'-triphosphate,3'-diphosphate pyrophosphatase